MQGETGATGSFRLSRVLSQASKTPLRACSPNLALGGGLDASDSASYVYGRD